MWWSAESSSRPSWSAGGAVPASTARGQVAALDVLHHQVRPLARVVVVDGDQVRVLEAGGDLRLAAEAPAVVVLGGQRVGEHLDRDLAVEPLVGRQPDDGHPAVPEHAVEHVTAAQPAARRRSAAGRRAPAGALPPPCASNSSVGWSSSATTPTHSRFAPELTLATRDLRGASISRLRIFPVGPLGSSSTNQTSRGYL